MMNPYERNKARTKSKEGIDDNPANQMNIVRKILSALITIMFLLNAELSCCVDAYFDISKLKCSISFGYFSAVCLEVGFHRSNIINSKEKFFSEVLLACVLWK